MRSTPVLEVFLKGAGHDVTVDWEAGALSDADAMAQYDALVFNTLRANDIALNEAEQAGMKGFIGGGKGFVCIHISGCVPDTWPEYREITGGGWVMGTSFHPPYGQFTVNVNQATTRASRASPTSSPTTSCTWASSTATTTTCS